MPSNETNDAKKAECAAPSSSSKRPVVPAGSFADVLEDLAKGDSSGENHSWARPPPPDIVDTKPSLTFQNLDIREGVDSKGHSEIHLFGVTKSGHSMLTRVRKFEHYFYYPAPSGFSEDDLSPLRDFINDIFGPECPTVSGVELQNQSTSPGGRKIPFLKINVCNHRNLHKLTFESGIPYFLRYMIDTDITALKWLKIPAQKYTVVPSEVRISCCQLEVSIDEADLLICDTVDDREKFAPLRIFCFDIECNIPENSGFSNARSESVIQIGNMVSVYGQTTPFIRNIFTLGTCSPISGTQVLSFDEEKDMLMAWHDFFMEVDPDIVIGYNITQFDIPYLLQRAWVLKQRKFTYLGRIKAAPMRFDPTKGRSNFFTCPSYDGRLLLDVFHHIREYHPGLKGDGVYKLNGVSMHFLGQRKEDIDYKQIPILQHGDADSRRDLAIYCMKDVYLPLRLFEKLKCFEKEVKAAKAAHVSFNMMRVWRSLQDVAKRYLDAVEHQYVIADKL